MPGRSSASAGAQTIANGQAQFDWCRQSTAAANSVFEWAPCEGVGCPAGERFPCFRLRFCRSPSRGLADCGKAL